MIGSPIKLHEIPKHSDLLSTRENLYEEESNKIIGSRGMIFSKNITDKERVVSTINNKKHNN